MMGDYFEFSLIDAEKHCFKKVHISAHWAKMLKISMSTPQTHVRHGAIDLKKGVEHLNRMGIRVPVDREFNTAREIYDYLISEYGLSLEMLRKVCVAAKRYAEGITAGIPVITHLVSYEGDIITDSE
jgi:cobalt-precorrin-5B (C1)-methyltransferase